MGEAMSEAGIATIFILVSVLGVMIVIWRELTRMSGWETDNPYIDSVQDLLLIEWLETSKNPTDRALAKRKKIRLEAGK